MPPPPPQTDIPTFAATQLSLLDAELQAELAETSLILSGHPPATLQRAGLAILNLHISAQRTGLGGKTVVELELDPAVKGAGAELPEHGIRTGDIVGVQEQPAGSAKKKEKSELKKSGVDGVVLRVTSTTVAVALDKEDVDVPQGKLWLCVSHATHELCAESFADCTLESSLPMMSRTRGVFCTIVITTGSRSICPHDYGHFFHTARIRTNASAPCDIISRRYSNGRPG